VKLEKYKFMYISHFPLLHTKKNKKKIMPQRAEDIKSEVSRQESKVSG
jgi:hypothetical protein